MSERIARVNGLDIAYETFGDSANPPLLLVMGLGAQMILWRDELCELLAGRGFFVIRFDNRDVGRSSKTRGRPPAVWPGLLGRRITAAYNLDDMADDAVGLLDELGIGVAHVVGASMGGMIAQTIAARHPDRVLSLTSIMSTTGRRTVGWQNPRLLPRLLERRATTREAYVASSARFWAVIGSVAYPDTEESVLARAAETWDRGVSASGVARQMVAILAQPDRTKRLRELQVPALVIHGLDDKMVHVSGGRATSHAIPGSELLLVPGMGHDLPVQLQDTFVEAIRRVATRAAR
jgi:pimeloyl-ACP methyl ester carboxylesterase